MGSDCCGVNKQYITNNFLLVIFTSMINNISFNVVIYVLGYGESSGEIGLLIISGNQKSVFVTIYASK